MQIRRRDRLLVAVFLLLGCAIESGCGDGKPSVDTSLNEATVTGLVTLEGQPVKGGIIYFNPSNHARQVPMRSAPIGDDGKYTIKTYTGDNQVTFGGDLAKTNMGLALRREYADVRGGENQFDFDLSSAGKKLELDVSKKATPTSKPRRR